jgi:hypothetical protein
MKFGIVTALALAFATQVHAQGISDGRKAMFPEASASDVAAWMVGEYASGASVDMTILKRTEDGFRFVYIDTPMIFAGDADGEFGGKRKSSRCTYDIPKALGLRILDAARAVLRKTGDSGDEDAPLGKHYEVFARDGAKALHGRSDNPPGDSEPAMLASVLTPFGNNCPHHALQQEGDLESSLGQLERRLLREKQR